MVRAEPAPAGYDPTAFPPVAVTVDVAVLTLTVDGLQVLLIERGAPPYLGAWALPGGFIHPDENLDQAAARELQEETGVRAARHLEQFGAYGDPHRDPRIRVVTVAYLAIIPTLSKVAGGSDARRAELVPVREIMRRRSSIELAFDHRRVLADALTRATHRLETTSIATAFVGREFTLSQLRHVYEAFWMRELDQGNFRRKVLATPGFVIPTGKRAASGAEGGKPADVYRAGKAAQLDPPLRRSA